MHPAEVSDSKLLQSTPLLPQMDQTYFILSHILQENRMILCFIIQTGTIMSMKTCAFSYHFESMGTNGTFHIKGILE
jgi:hypothetical protein